MRIVEAVEEFDISEKMLSTGYIVQDIAMEV